MSPLFMIAGSVLAASVSPLFAQVQTSSTAEQVLVSLVTTCEPRAKSREAFIAPEPDVAVSFSPDGRVLLLDKKLAVAGVENGNYHGFYATMVAYNREVQTDCQMSIGPVSAEFVSEVVSKLDVLAKERLGQESVRLGGRIERSGYGASTLYRWVKPDQPTNESFAVWFGEEFGDLSIGMKIANSLSQ